MEFVLGNKKASDLRKKAGFFLFIFTVLVRVLYCIFFIFRMFVFPV